MVWFALQDKRLQTSSAEDGVMQGYSSPTFSSGTGTRATCYLIGYQLSSLSLSAKEKPRVKQAGGGAAAHDRFARFFGEAAGSAARFFPSITSSASSAEHFS